MRTFSPSSQASPHRVLPLILLFVVGCMYESAAPTAPNSSLELKQSNAEPTQLQQLPSPESIAIDLVQPSQQSPVSVAMGIGPADVVAPGEVLLVVRAQLADGWHLYAAEGPTGVGTPTKLKLTLPPGFEAGEWSLPSKETKSSEFGDVGMYHGAIEFSVPITVTSEAALGSQSVLCEFAHQACTDSQCLPPSKLQLTTTINVE